jgi:dihydroflavonol-4-reductase
MKSSEKRNPYFYSKRLSEQAAQNFVYEHQGDVFDLIVINVRFEWSNLDM